MPRARPRGVGAFCVEISRAGQDPGPRSGNVSCRSAAGRPHDHTTLSSADGLHVDFALREPRLARALWRSVPGVARLPRPRAWRRTRPRVALPPGPACARSSCASGRASPRGGRSSACSRRGRRARALRAAARGAVGARAAAALPRAPRRRGPQGRRGGRDAHRGAARALDERGPPHARACGASVALVARPEGVAARRSERRRAGLALPATARAASSASRARRARRLERREPVMYEGGGGGDDDDDDEVARARGARAGAWRSTRRATRRRWSRRRSRSRRPGLRAVDGPPSRPAAGRTGAPATDRGSTSGRSAAVRTAPARDAARRAPPPGRTPGDEAACRHRARDLPHARALATRPARRSARRPNVRNSRGAAWQTARDACVRARATEVVFAVGLKVTGDCTCPRAP